MKSQLRYYYVKEDYIAFLRQYEAKVAFNKDESRPYIGIVLEIEGIQYYAPLTSRGKRSSEKNQKDYRRIQGGQYGAINFRYMIPVPQEALIPIVFSNVEDARYRALLQNQNRAILAEQPVILEIAAKLRTLLFTENQQLTPYDRVVKERCVNLPLLETIYQNWIEK